MLNKNNFVNQIIPVINNNNNINNINCHNNNNSPNSNNSNNMNYYHGNDNYNQINNSINSNISPSIVPNKLNNINQNQIIINNLNQKESKNNSNQNQVLNNNYNSNILYLFPKIGLKNIVGTYMNATLQCFLHVSELTVYFLCEYPYEKNYLINKNHGKISIAFYELVKAVCEDEYKRKKIANNYKLHSSVNDDPNSQKKLEKIETHSSNPSFSIFFHFYSRTYFKGEFGIFKQPFKKFEADNSKDLILYLMQTMHEELNYFSDNPSLNLSQTNQYDKVNAFMYYMNSYNALNFSIISNIFYGTYEIAALCHKCNILLYNYQKFEFISFEMFDYEFKEFDIYNGFEDNSKPQQLRGENQFYCNICKN